MPSTDPEADLARLDLQREFSDAVWVPDDDDAA
jgi:hypothetical protein